MVHSFLTADSEMPGECSDDCIYICQRIDASAVNKSSFLTGLKGSKGLACLPDGVTLQDFNLWLKSDSTTSILTPQNLATVLKVWPIGTRLPTLTPAGACMTTLSASDTFIVLCPHQPHNYLIGLVLLHVGRTRFRCTPAASICRPQCSTAPCVRRDHVCAHCTLPIDPRLRNGFSKQPSTRNWYT